MIFHAVTNSIWRSADDTYHIYAGIRDFAVYTYGKNNRGYKLLGKTQSLAEAQKLCEKDSV